MQSFEIEGDAARIYLPDNIKDIRIFAGHKRVDIARNGNEVKTRVSDRQPGLLELTAEERKVRRNPAA
jgi:hypothetical protein